MTLKAITNHKRGDRFARRVTVSPMTNFAAATVTAEIRTLEYVLIAALTVDMTEAATSVVTISKSDTTDWPLSDLERPHLLDIKFSGVDGIARTETIGVVVSREVTT